MKQRKEVFQEIYDHNFWASNETCSGGGSELKNTQNVIKELPKLLFNYNIDSILDCACGDLNWIKTIDLPIHLYIGLDIVPEIIEKNKRSGMKNASFYVSDFVSDPLPCVDLILCKDVFIHLCNSDILKAIENFKKSGAKYLLVTNNFQIKENIDCNTGECRGMNFQISPFNFSKPIDNIEIGVADSNLTLFKL